MQLNRMASRLDRATVRKHRMKMQRFILPEK